MKQPTTPTPLTKAEAEEIIREYDAEVRDVIEKIINSEPDVSIQLGAMIEGTTERVRVVIVEHMRRVMQEQAEDRRQELEQHLAHQRELEAQKTNRSLWQRWVSYWISRQTMARILWFMNLEPAHRRAAEMIGKDMAQSGVGQARAADRRDLGQMSSVTQQVNQPGYGKDKGRGNV